MRLGCGTRATGRLSAQAERDAAGGTSPKGWSEQKMRARGRNGLLQTKASRVQLSCTRKMHVAYRKPSSRCSSQRVHTSLLSSASPHSAQKAPSGSCKKSLRDHAGRPLNIAGTPSPRAHGSREAHSLTARSSACVARNQRSTPILPHGQPARTGPMASGDAGEPAASLRHGAAAAQLVDSVGLSCGLAVGTREEAQVRRVEGRVPPAQIAPFDGGDLGSRRR